MALRHHERRVATGSAHTLQANISHDTTNHPAHQRHAAFTPPCFALPSGTAHANALSTKAAQISLALRHNERPLAARSAHTLENTRSSHASISCETSSKSHASSLPNERFVRDLLQKSHVKSPKRAFRTRPPQKVTRQVSKTSVSYETSSKSHTSSLQNERFVRDFLKKSPVKSPKRAFRTSLPPKVKRKHPSEHTHHAVLPSSFTIAAPANNTRSHANPNVTATFTSTTTHNLTIPCACHESFRVHTSDAHKVLRLPRNVTSVTPRNLTIPCACHEHRTSTPQSPSKVLRLPRKVTISSVSFNRICTTPHGWNDFDPF